MDVIATLGERLSARAQGSTRDWWERYLKGTARFRGVPMAGVREEAHALAAEAGLDALDARERKRIAYSFIEQPFTEDKLAGVLLLRERWLDDVSAADLPDLAALFDAGHVADWGICDWFCVKVLAPLVERDGQPFADALARWTEAPGRWRRRAAAVSLAPPAPRGDAVFDGFTRLALEIAASNVSDPERFSQTGVGWLLRELSKAEPAAVRAFVAEHDGELSREARRMALAKIEGRGRR
jgi:3-methyladenine DNA glycosylase AlkD